MATAPDLLKAFPDLEFLVAGDGRYRPALERVTERLRINGGVHFLGFVNDTASVYRQIDVLVHATFDPGESMPANILEAAAMGVPAVATRWAGIPEIVRDGETGILVPPQDVNALRDALLRLITDPALRTTMGENARAFVSSRFSMKAVAQTFIRDINKPLLAPQSNDAVVEGRSGRGSSEFPGGEENVARR